MNQGQRPIGIFSMISHNHGPTCVRHPLLKGGCLALRNVRSSWKAERRFGTRLCMNKIKRWYLRNHGGKVRNPRDNPML